MGIPELEETLRIEGGRVLATLIRMTRDIGAAEDALQEASIVALSSWQTDGVPEKPGAWLLTVARRKALDRIRRETARLPKERESVQLLTTGPMSAQDQRQDELSLLFTCCHPALSAEAQVALALRTVSGMTTVQIARVFLVPEPTMGQRISRAKKKIKIAQIPYRVPEDHELPDRLPAVLSTIYLIFTAGHSPEDPSQNLGALYMEEAIRLGRRLVYLMPDEPECVGLLSLMLSVAAREPGRVGPEGAQLLLEDQDRSSWNMERSEAANRLLEQVLPLGRVGPYQLQAAIASLHTLAPTYQATDWPQICDLYFLLQSVQPTPVVQVNRAVAEAMVSGPEHGLQLLRRVSGLDHWHLFWSTKAHFLEQVDDKEAALDAYERALQCRPNPTDTAFLHGSIQRLRSQT